MIRRYQICFIVFSLVGVFSLFWMPDQGFSHEDHHVEIVEKNGYRYIESNGIPEHATGQFPNRNNPNQIREQKHRYRVTMTPKFAEKLTPVKLFPFGVAINGVPLDPGAAEYWNRDFNSPWQYEALSGKINLGMDQNNAHVQPTGSYHYHGLPTGLIKKLKADKKMALIGYAADGFPIYNGFGYKNKEDLAAGFRKLMSSYQLKKGTRPSGPGGKYDGTFVADYEYVKEAGDLDQCNGMFGPTPENPEGEYHYHLTEAFPFIPRYLKGEVDPSFLRHGPPGGPGGRRPPPPFGRPPFGFPPPRR